MRIVFAASLFAAALFAETPAFEVASIKPAAPPTDGRIMVRMGGDAGRVDYTNVSLLNIITAAYKVKEHQISGPEWLSSVRFDLTAKLPEGASRDQVPAMLQNFLADRFKLVTHKETKVMPSYALVVAKGGPKLQETDAPAGPEGGARMMMGPKGRRMTGKITMKQLADNLSRWLDRPVTDATELTKVYDIDLQWTGDEGPQSLRALRGPGPGGPEGGGPRPEGHNDDSADAPALPTALQEKLGLRLDSRKEPADIITIDHIERAPTEN
jgi:uncharacterized protein (TIGR03435 family)